MLVRKILETVLTAGNTSVSVTDSDIPYSLIRTYCSDDDIYPVSRTITGNTLTLNYEAQSSDKYIAVEIVKQGLDIVDDLLSTDADKALSANQGKVLKDLIDGIVIPTVPENITDLNDVKVTDITANQVLAWDAVSEKFINVDQSGGGSGEGDVYSTTKTEVGMWIDNSKVYRQVFDLGSDVSVANNSWYTTSIKASTIKYILNARGMRSNGTFFPLMSECESTYITLLAARANAAATVRYLILDFVEN